MQVLLDIKSDVGRMNGTLDSHVKQFDKHVEDDRMAYRTIIELKTGQARQKGFLTAVGVMGSGLGAALGWMVEKITLGHH